MATATQHSDNSPRSSKTAAQQNQQKTNNSGRENGSGYGQGAMIGAAAAGLLAGLAATIGRKAAVQAVSSLSGDWFEVLKAEHEAARKLFDRIEATENSQTTKRAMLMMQLKHALAKHAFEEENVIYPTLRDHGNAESADHLNYEHGYVKQFLFDLDHMQRNTSAWLDKVRKFRAEIEKHMREEEETIFPALHARLGEKTNAELSSAVTREGFKLA